MQKNIEFALRVPRERKPTKDGRSYEYKGPFFQIRDVATIIPKASPLRSENFPAVPDRKADQERIEVLEHQLSQSVVNPAGNETFPAAQSAEAANKLDLTYEGSGAIATVPQVTEYDHVGNVDFPKSAAPDKPVISISLAKAPTHRSYRDEETPQKQPRLSRGVRELRDKARKFGIDADALFEALPDEAKALGKGRVCLTKKFSEVLATIKSHVKREEDERDRGKAFKLK